MLNTVYDFAHKGLLNQVKDAVVSNKQLISTPDSNKRLLIHWAALSGNSDLVKFLIDEGSPVDPPDDIGLTPLILASSANRSEVVHLLLERGADVNRRSDEGHSSIQYASSKGWKQILRLLIENGADVNVPDRRGATPLHRAASNRGNVEIVETLLAAGAKPNAQDSFANSPLHLACEESNVPAALALIRGGASTDLTNKEKKTPLELAPAGVARTIQEAISGQELH